MLDYLPERILSEDFFSQEKEEILLDSEPLQFLVQNSEEPAELKLERNLDEFLFQNQNEDLLEQYIAPK